jgi:hypothetical protein
MQHLLLLRAHLGAITSWAIAQPSATFQRKKLSDLLEEAFCDSTQGRHPAGHVAKSTQLGASTEGLAERAILR